MLSLTSPRHISTLRGTVAALGRSLQDLIAFLSDVHGYGVDLFLHQQGVDTTTPGGKALFQMMGVFAEFERAMIRERVKAGLERAKAQGKTLRPAADRRREGSRDQRRFASGQGRHHEGRGGAWRGSRGSDQGGAGRLRAARLGAIRFYGPRRVLRG